MKESPLQTAERIAYEVSIGPRSTGEISAAIHQAILQHCNAELERRRVLEQLQFEVGTYCKAKWGADPKQRGRKLLEESAEVMVACSDAWKLKQGGKDALVDEIGDVGVVLFSIAHNFEINALDAIRLKFRRVQIKHGPPVVAPPHRDADTQAGEGVSR